MPKKTKLQKMLAQERRAAHVRTDSHLLTSHPIPTHPAHMATTYIFTQSSERSHHAPSTEMPISAAQATEFDLIKKDLRQTLLLICTLLIVELVLWQYT